MVDEDSFHSYMQVIDIDGNLVEQIFIPEIDYLSVSHYSNVDSCFYLSGLSIETDSMIFVKMDQNGMVLWRRAFYFNEYSSNAPYNITEKNDEILLTYSLFNVSGPSVSSAVGYIVVNSLGNILRQNQPFSFPAAPVPIISYVSEFDQDGNAVLGVTNFLGPCSIIKFNKITGLPTWIENFNLENNDIQSLVIDEIGNIYFSGYDNLLLKLSPDGSTIFEKTLGFDGFHGAKRLLLQGDYLFANGYRYNENADKSQMYISQINPIDGQIDWLWYYDDISNQFGLSVEDAVFANDSTLFIIGSATAEYEFIMKLNLNSSVSVFEEVELDKILIYPNPTISNQVQLNTNGISGRAVLRDINGKMLFNQIVHDGDTIWLPSCGLFFLFFESSENRIAQKVISIHK
ncbi:MAG TPA: hypothetical protein DCF44_05740 [Chitinophagaceae bacterium]|nr:hypothetical protein [Chitinophagaceae bacterium]